MTEKLRERSKSLALKTLAAVEAVERRVASGETGPAVRQAAEQIRGAIESLLSLDEPPIGDEEFIDRDTKCLAVHLDTRVKALEEQIAGTTKNCRSLELT